MTDFNPNDTQNTLRHIANEQAAILAEQRNMQKSLEKISDILESLKNLEMNHVETLGNIDSLRNGARAQGQRIGALEDNIQALQRDAVSLKTGIHISWTGLGLGATIALLLWGYVFNKIELAYELSKENSMMLEFIQQKKDIKQKEADDGVNYFYSGLPVPDCTDCRPQPVPPPRPDDNREESEARA